VPIYIHPVRPQVSLRPLGRGVAIGHLGATHEGLWKVRAQSDSILRSDTQRVAMPVPDYAYLDRAFSKNV
jgi:hypothetical protein